MERFSMPRTLNRHKRETHTKKEFLCEIDDCDRGIPGKGFRRRLNLNGHIGRIHKKLAPTNSAFSPTNRLTTDTPYVSDNYSCVTCKSRFSQTSSLNHHQREIHEDREYLCGTKGCARGVPREGFHRRNDLAEHMKHMHQNLGPISDLSPTSRLTTDICVEEASEKIVTLPAVASQRETPIIFRKEKRKPSTSPIRVQRSILSNRSNFIRPEHYFI